ncbi:hypothetical protein EVAR_79597_1 [Eumeta japonica]|uniref:Uncharacterized protein n=1 Tax=Eumeta variegata TaxID=151549 RepID=A0A4C1UF40_EUMVA|nr:hypothetical protein EVAR_79597_1 [Eumeta japonica]
MKGNVDGEIGGSLSAASPRAYGRSFKSTPLQLRRTRGGCSLQLVNLFVVRVMGLLTPVQRLYGAPFGESGALPPSASTVIVLSGGGERGRRD